MTWIKEKLGKRAQVISGYAFKSSDFLDYSKSNIPIIKIKNIKNGYVDIDNDTQYVSKNKLNLDKKYIVENGDILISLTGSQITQPNSVVGRIAKCYFPNFQICLLNQRAGKFLINEDKMNRNFLFYLLTYDKYKQALALMGHGAASQANISPLQIENLEIFFPDDTKEQDKIAKFLSNYDDLIENNNRRIKILEEMAQKIYKEWFVDFKFPGHETTTFKASPLGKIPNDWEVGKLQDIVEFFNGYAFKSKELLKHPQKNSLSVFKQGHINRGGGFNYSGTKSWFPREKSIELKKYILKKGDLLMAMTDMKNNVAILGNTAIMPMDNSYILNQRVGLLRCKNNLNISYPYVYMVTNSEPFLLNLRSRANSGVQVNLSTEQIKLSKLIIPASHINKLFNELITPIFEQIFLINKKNENLKQTRDILLPRLISGEINVENMEVL